MADPLPEFPYVLQNGVGNLPDADQVMADYQHIRNWLNARFGNLLDKQLLIANASGQIVGRTLSGDATISNTGVLTIANDAINSAKIALAAVDSAELATAAVQTAKIADDAVTNAKIADNAVDTLQIAGGAVTSGRVNLTTATDSLAAETALGDTYSTFCSITPAAGTWIVLATIRKTNVAQMASRVIQGGTTVHELFPDADEQDWQRTHIGILASSGAALNLQAKRTGGSGGFVRGGSETKLIGVRIA